MKTYAAAILTAYAAATSQPWSEGTTLVNDDNIGTQASNFSFSEAFISDQDFVQGVNLASDVLIAIEAIRIEINDLNDTLDLIGTTVKGNEDAYTAMHGDWTTADAQADTNATNMGTNAGSISDNDKAIKAIEDAIADLKEQVDDQLASAKLFCHQFIYTSVIPAECAAILKNGDLITAGGDRIAEVFVWPTASATTTTTDATTTP